MLKAIIELSKYILVINIFLYTVTSFIALRWDDRERKSFIFVLQYIMILVNHITSSLVLLSSRQDFTYLFFPVFQMLAVFAYLVLMRAIYPKSDRLILSHIAMLLSIGFVILTRLSLTRSMRQFIIVAVSLVIGLIVPRLIKQFKLIKRCELIFAGVGIGILGAVLISGRFVNGSKLSFSVFGLSFQPSEFVKIIYVLFIACLLARAKHFYHILYQRRCCSSCIDSRGIKGFGQRIDLFYYLCDYAVCRNKKGALSDCRTCRSNSGLLCILLYVFSCTCACRSMA